MRKVFRFVSVAAALLAMAACAQRPSTEPAAADVKGPTPAADAPKSVVPQVASLSVGEVDKLVAVAGLVPILRFEPGVVSADGTVVGTDPPAGTLLPAGEVVTVIVAGAPGGTLDDYVTAHRETFVGIGVDNGGVIVIGVHQKADLNKEMAQLSARANGAPFRVQSCARSWADLQRLQLELARRDFVPGAEKLAFGMTIDPLACAVRLTIDLSDAEIAQLTARYQGALVIQKGTAARL